MQFRATHFMSLQNALYSIPSVQHTFCHYERKTGSPRDTLYPWGKGANKHKSEHYRPDNAISKVQCAPCSAILCHFVRLVDTFCGKNKPDPCQRDTFRAFYPLLSH